MSDKDELERQKFEKWVCDEYPWGPEALNDSVWVSRKDGRGYYIVPDKYDCLCWSFIGWLARSKQEQSDGDTEGRPTPP